MSDRNHDRNKDTELDLFFDAARRTRPDPSEALMVRVLADALDAQAQQTPVVRTARRSAPLWMQLRDALGGWPALGGLAAAGVAGLFIGFSAPAGVGDLTATLLGQSADSDIYLVDLMPELDFDIAMDLNEG
jgi:hypothetical protein